MVETHTNKDHDYAEKEPLGNFRSSTEINVLPWIGVICRMGDKYNRVISVSSKDVNKVDEKIGDTLLDLSIYCLIDYILFEQWLDIRNGKSERYITYEKEFEKFRELVVRVMSKVKNKTTDDLLYIKEKTKYERLTADWLNLINLLDAKDENYMYDNKEKIKGALLDLSASSTFYLV